MGLIYKVTNITNQKIYIGQTTRDLQKRKKEHESSVYNKPTYFHNALLKYGFNNFTWEIIEDNITERLLNDREKYWVAFFSSNDKQFGYNSTEGGDNYDALNIWRQNNPELSNYWAKIGYKKMREILEANPEKEILRKEKAKIATQSYAKNHVKEKQEQGKQIYLNHKKQQDQQMINFHKQQSKPVKCIETNKIYPSASEAGRQTNISQGNISACCRGQRQSAGKTINNQKLHWIYLDKEHLTDEEKEVLNKYNELYSR